MAYSWFKDKGFYVWMSYVCGSIYACSLLEIPPLAWFMFAFLPFLLYWCLIRWLKEC